MNSACWTDSCMGLRRHRSRCRRGGCVVVGSSRGKRGRGVVGPVGCYTQRRGAMEAPSCGRRAAGQRELGGRDDADGGFL